MTTVNTPPDDDEQADDNATSVEGDQLEETADPDNTVADESDDLNDPSKTFIAYDDPDSDSEELTTATVEEYHEKGLG